MYCVYLQTFGKLPFIIEGEIFVLATVKQCFVFYLIYTMTVCTELMTKGTLCFVFHLLMSIMAYT